MPSIWDLLQGQRAPYFPVDPAQAGNAPPSSFGQALTQGLAADPTLGQTSPGLGAYAGHLAQDFISKLSSGPELTRDVMQRAAAGDPMSSAEIAPRAFQVAQNYGRFGMPLAPRSAAGAFGGRLIQPTIEEAPAKGILNLTKEGAADVAGGALTKPIKDFTPADWGAYGKQYGVPNLGPSSNKEFEKSLVPIQTESGRTVTVPGGIADETKPFSYYDLLHLKAQGINPNDLKPELHRAIHNRMVSTMQPAGQFSDPQIFNQLAFGMTSPNSPLTPNAFTVARVMAKSPEDINNIANMVPWKYGDKVPAAVRDQYDADIARTFGIQAEDKGGGLGTRGTVNYTRVAELAQMMRDKPDFFRFKGEGEGGASPSENWARFVSRVASQVPGLSIKTGSLGSVFQAPREAAISAIDRHMAGKLEADIFENPEERAAWTKNTLDAFNAKRPADKQVSSLDEMRDSGGKGEYVDKILGYLNKHPNPQLTTAKGLPNPNVPAWMHNVDWVKPPTNVTYPSQPYVRALEANAQSAAQNQQGLFSNQWMTWDKLRNRLEPHEMMFPGLDKLPKMDLPQVRDALAAHGEAGYLGGAANMKPVRPVKNPSSLGYFSLPLVLGGAAAAAPMFAQQRQQQ